MLKFTNTASGQMLLSTAERRYSLQTELLVKTHILRVLFRNSSAILCVSLFSGMAPSIDSGEVEKHLNDALPVLEWGINKAKSDQVFFCVKLFLCIVALVALNNFSCEAWSVVGTCLGVTKAVLVLIAGACFWLAAIMCNIEINGLTSAKKDVNNMLKSNPIM